MPEQASPHLAVPSQHQPTARSVSPNTDFFTDPSSLDQLTVTHIANSFRELVYPAIVSCKDFSLKAPNDPHAIHLGELFQDPERRQTTWMYLATQGMPWNLSQGQQHALISSLVPYIAQDASYSWPGVYILTEHSVSTDDMVMYKLLGEVVRSSEIPEEMLLVLSGCFLQCSTHNVSRQPAYTPWMELFLEKGDARVFHLANAELRERVFSGEFSTYDHILTLMCRSQSQDTADILRRSVSPPTPPRELPELPLKTLLTLGASGMLTTLPFSAAFSLLTDGVSGVFSLQTLLGALFSSALITVTAYRRTFHELFAQEVREMQEILSCPSYLHYADQVYGKLCELLPTRPRVAETLNSMDKNPAFSHMHEAWQKLRASVD